MQNKYNMGDRICGNKTGTITPSTIVGVVTADFYLEKMSNQEMSVWERLYPDFKEKYVYISKFDEPTITYSFEEMLTQVREPLEDRLGQITNMDVFLYQISNSETVLKLYYDLSPKSISVAYPEDDIIRLDDIC